MAQWQALLHLKPDLQSDVRLLYQGKFPLDIRRCLAHWIEQQDWEFAAEDEARARTTFQTILLKLDELERSRSTTATL
ncbi:hypothetical protein WMY93_002143 [Mugilogobius chulae]|uniref:STAT transcription factor protein interaction domain-containing protein n=1 Tax=Mugilogobius chulae TaxID=88201 RepID=A0AAW0Q3N9_9GOBI